MPLSESSMWGGSPELGSKLRESVRISSAEV